MCPHVLIKHLCFRSQSLVPLRVWTVRYRYHQWYREVTWGSQEGFDTQMLVWGSPSLPLAHPTALTVPASSPTELNGVGWEALYLFCAPRFTFVQGMGFLGKSFLSLP